ncbi:hypothetical protein A3L11_07005 [Thermococcus siculi]|uniref:Uncharacterized protein n=1 Tax=Thermococcus siculi TaxID=72803 RepID=A0A2Z2MQQ5_9EURY|nr:hypothetical protein [Thermococcus siculi]ASJ08987.1 hypothetical protein A3L11_07005 [Thermococcus siculi]
MGKALSGKTLFVFPVALAILGLLWNTGIPTTYTQLNGTFSGGLVIPSAIAGDVEDYFSGMNATLYGFEAGVVGDINASITLYVLKVTPPFDPEDFEVSINGRLIRGETYVPYAEEIPVQITYMGRDYSFFLTVQPAKIFKASGSWDVSYLNNATNVTLIKMNDLKLVVYAMGPEDYEFAVCKTPENTEITRGGLTLGGQE